MRWETKGPELLVHAATGTGEPPIPYDELFEVARVTLEAAGRGEVRG